MGMTIRDLMTHFKGLDVTIELMGRKDNSDELIGHYEDIEDMMKCETRNMPDKRVKDWVVSESSDGPYVIVVIARK